MGRQPTQTHTPSSYNTGTCCYCCCFHICGCTIRVYTRSLPFNNQTSSRKLSTASFQCNATLRQADDVPDTAVWYCRYRRARRQQEVLQNTEPMMYRRVVVNSNMYKTCVHKVVDLQQRNKPLKAFDGIFPVQRHPPSS